MLLFTSGGLLARDENSILVAGTEISGLLGLNQSGPYYKIFNELVADYPTPVKLLVTPMRRATRSFVLGQSDCIFSGSDTPGYYEQLGVSGLPILSDGIYEIRTKIYGPKGGPAIESAAELKGKFLAIDTGIGGADFTAKRVGHDINLVLVASSLSDGFEMLDSGRVAGLVAIDSDVEYLKAKHPQYKGYSVSSTFTVNVGNDLVACQKQPKTVDFIRYLNRRIASFKQSGRIEVIMRDAIYSAATAQ